MVAPATRNLNTVRKATSKNSESDNHSNSFTVRYYRTFSLSRNENLRVAITRSVALGWPLKQLLP